MFWNTYNNVVEVNFNANISNQRLHATSNKGKEFLLMNLNQS